VGRGRRSGCGNVKVDVEVVVVVVRAFLLPEFRRKFSCVVVGPWLWAAGHAERRSRN